MQRLVFSLFLVALSSARADDEVRPEALAALVEEAKRQSSSAVVVVHRGAVVLEHYASDELREEKVCAMSASKSIASLAIGMLIDEGKLTGLDQPAAEVFTEWKGTEKEPITLRMLLTHTSGLDPERTCVKTGRIADALGSKLLSPPGTAFRYNNAAVDLLALLVKRAAGEGLDAYLDKRLFRPLGVTDVDWVRDQDGLPRAAGELLIRARDLARVGELVLAGGEHEGKRLVSQEWLARSMEPGTPLAPECGLLWWRDCPRMRVGITEPVLAGWRAAGVDPATIEGVAPMVGQPLLVPEFRRRIRTLVEPAAVDALNQAIVPKGVMPWEVLETGPVLPAAKGWLGQFLVIDREARLVAVRMRRARQSDYEEGSQEQDGFRDFSAHVYGLTRVE